MTWQGASVLERELRARGAKTRLAEALGKPLQTISHWTRGVRPDPALWPAIESALGLAPGTLNEQNGHIETVDIDGLRVQIAELSVEVKRQAHATEQLEMALARQTDAVRDLAAQLSIALHLLPGADGTGAKTKASRSRSRRRA